MNSIFPLCCLKTGSRIFGKKLNIKSVSFISTSSRSLARNHYECLGVSKDANTDQIKAAYFEKSKQYHPDMNPSKPELHKVFVELNEAYSVLGNSSKRRDYDQQLRYSNVSSVRYSYNPGHSAGPKHYDAYSPPPGFRHTVDFEDFGDYYRSYNKEASDPGSTNHLKVVLGLMLFMFAGAFVHLFFIRLRHESYKRYRDENDRKIMDTYNQVKENSVKSDFHKQLEIFLERQKTTAAMFSKKD